jgi:signal transduction histidine kinase
LVAGVGAVVLAITGDAPPPPAFLVLAVAISWGFVGSGLYARRRRPGSRSGTLMVLVGFAWMLPALANRAEPLLFTAGLMLESLWAGVLAHLVLTFPSGRLRDRLDRALVIKAYVAVTVLQVPPYLFSRGCDACPRHLLLVREDAATADWLLAFQLLAGLAVVLAMAWSLVRRWRRASRVERRPLEPLLWTGTLTIVSLIAVSTVALASERPPPAALYWLPAIGFVLVPFAFLAGLLRSRLYREAALTRFVGLLRSLPDPSSLRRILVEALGDPDVQVVYWARDAGGYVDAGGRPVEVPPPGVGRAATPVSGPAGPIAAIVHDAGLRNEPELVRAVGSAASLWLENERLAAELRARLAELSASRAHVVDAADAERRRIERDLHDGAQQRLVSLLLRLRLGRRAGAGPADLLDAAEEGLEQALAEVRALAAGILPPVLADQGLGPAVMEIAARHPLTIEVREVPDQRLPGPVETTAYFVVAEALANSAKHARADRVSLSVARRNGSLLVEVHDDGVGGADAARGSGLRGLAERVGALDGRLVCASVPGRGTSLCAEIPCA